MRDSMGRSSIWKADMRPRMRSPPKMRNMLSSRLRKKRVLPGSPCLRCRAWTGVKRGSIYQGSQPRGSQAIELRTVRITPRRRVEQTPPFMIKINKWEVFVGAWQDGPAAVHAVQVTNMQSLHLIQPPVQLNMFLCDEPKLRTSQSARAAGCRCGATRGARCR